MIEWTKPGVTGGNEMVAPSIAQLNVDAVLDLIRSREITDEQAKALNTALRERATEQLRGAFSQLGDALNEIGKALRPKPEEG